MSYFIYERVLIDDDKQNPFRFLYPTLTPVNNHIANIAMEIQEGKFNKDAYHLLFMPYRYLLNKMISLGGCLTELDVIEDIYSLPYLAAENVSGVGETIIGISEVILVYIKMRKNEHPTEPPTGKDFYKSMFVITNFKIKLLDDAGYKSREFNNIDIPLQEVNFKPPDTHKADSFLKLRASLNIQPKRSKGEQP